MAFTPKVWANSPATTTPLSAAALTDLENRVTTYNAGSGGGAVNIPGSESTASPTYTTLTTPDQVTGVVMPTNGLIAVWYQALWQTASTQTAKAAIFLGATQLKGQVTGSTTPQVVAVSSIGNTLQHALASSSTGLVTTVGAGLPSGADVATGELVGITDNPGNAGPCYIFAAAGTYTVSIQFLTPSSTVAASSRQLWVQALAFS